MTPISEPVVTAAGTPASTPASDKSSHSLHLHVSACASSIVLTALPMASLSTLDAATCTRHLRHQWPTLAPLLQLLQRCEPMEARALSKDHGESPLCLSTVDLCAQWLGG